MALRAAATHVEITPPVGLPLSGWCFGPSRGIADRLYARLLLLEDEGDRYVIVTADLIGLGTAYATDLRQRIAARVSTRAEHVLIACSHTHSGPGTMPLRRWGPIDDTYVAGLLQTIEDGVGGIESELESVEIASAVALIEGITTNRRNDPGAPTDNDVPVVAVKDADGTCIAILYSVSCHPVAAHGDRNLISADFPGYAARTIAEAFPGAEPMFLLGAAGDINPVDLHHIWLAEEYGTRIGRAVADAVSNAVPGTAQVVRAVVERVELPVAELPSIDYLRSESRRWRAEAERLSKRDTPTSKIEDALIKAEWAEEALDVVQSGDQASTLSMEIAGLRLGDSSIVGLPAEPFVAIGLAIKQHATSRNTIVSGLCNGSLCYLPTSDAYDAGGYETDFSAKVYGLYMLTREAESITRNAAATVVDRLR